MSSSLPRTFVNSIGMTLVRIEPGDFLMGQEDGDWDERPVHRVTIRLPFHMAVTEVTNAQYEQFDSAHRRLRGRHSLSLEDDEPVVFVSWLDAARFCEWLSQREGQPYRLPTEAEWEYACRAGTSTPFHTGHELPPVHHRHQKTDWFPHPVPLAVATTPPNAWGLHEMHGNVEEWCEDWYGPYVAEEQVDPVGRASGLFRVTRGGSHNTEVAFLRSANPIGALPEDKHRLIGFRVVLGQRPMTDPLPAPEPPICMQNVSQTKFDWSRGTDSASPRFDLPVRFVREPPRPADVPMFPHNHCPSITWCPNGDLLAAWFSTRAETGREMVILASRLRAGATAWDEPSLFFKAPDRNMTGSALFHDGQGTLYHFNGLEAGGMWANLALVLRTSRDNGKTWSAPRLIQPEHQPRNQVISGTLMTRDGYLIQACDAVYGAQGGTAIHVSPDRGQTWYDPGAAAPPSVFAAGASGSTIAGIHAGIAQLHDGSLLALGRGDDLPGSDPALGLRMPISRSKDLGRTWTYAPSEFPPINGGQRLVLLRLREGPLLLATFTDSSLKLKNPTGMPVPDGSGRDRLRFGLIACLSFDEGESWPVRKLVSQGGGPLTLDGGAWTRGFVMDSDHAEPKGYLAATQTPDGMIHLISSALYYRFNIAWLRRNP